VDDPNRSLKERGPGLQTDANSLRAASLEAAIKNAD
jgi:hypothetical protein